MSNDSSASSRPASHPESFTVGVPPSDRPTDSSAAPARSSDKLAPSLEAELVDQTKQQIRSLVQEIAELSRSQCSTEEFFEGFLTRTTSALASLGGAIWMRESEEAPLRLGYQINLKQTRLATDESAQTRHHLLLNRLVEQGESTLVGPHSGTDNEKEAGNPTPHLLVVSPLRIDSEVVGLLEIFQRPNTGPTTQRGYLRFVTQMADLASEFLVNQRIRSFAQHQTMWQRLEQFIQAVHLGLDTRQTVYTIANEGRRLIECDRLSVAIGVGRHCRVQAVSGLDSIERRADQVKRLGNLAAIVIRTGEPLWYNGDDTDLPPQIEKRLHPYVDKSHCKMLAIIPLKKRRIPQGEETDDARPSRRKSEKPMGALIIEQLKDSEITPALRQRTEVLVTHSETALTNSFEHNGIFLMPLWKLLGRVTSFFRGGRLVKTIALLGAVAGLVFFLMVYPYPFGLGAKGTLIPKTQHEVFAQVDGLLQEIYVADQGDTYVKKGQILARMTNNDLMVSIENLQGQIANAREKLHTNEVIRSQQRLDPIDRQMIDGEIKSALQTIKSLQNELQLKMEEAKLLDVVSPSDGQVINWQVRQNLLRRPVLRGQNLMTIVDPETEWQIELEMPERRVSHLIWAMSQSDEPLKVTFGLVSHPGVEYTGRVLAIDRQLDVHSDEGNTALVRVGFSNADVPVELLRSGTRVTAKVDCGVRPIGYVMFHELFETIQSRFLFWF